MARVMVLAALFCFLPFAMAQESNGTLRVVVEPSDARLILGGGQLGGEVILQHDVERDLVPGRYDLEASREGFEEYRQEVTIEAGQTYLLRIPLAAEASDERREGWGFVTGFTFAFLSLFLIGLLVYLWSIQTRYYALVRETLGLVDEVRGEQVPSFQAGLRQEGVPEDVAVKIEGPRVVPIGRESTEFVASSSDGTDLAQLAWTVEPAGRALVTPTVGGRVKVIAADSGALKLRATWTANGKAYEGAFDTVASTPQTRSLTIPWVGAGFGSIMLAAMVIAVLVILGFFGILDGGVIGTVLGSIAGYLFGFRAGQDGN